MIRIHHKTLLVALLFTTLIHGAAFAQRGPATRTGPGGFPPGPEFARHEFGSPGHPGGPPPPPWAPGPRQLERLGLTDAQRAKIEALHETNLRAMIRAEADVRIAELDLGKLIEQDTPDARAIDAAAERVGALRLSMHKSMIAEALGVRAVLTPDQRARLRKLGPARGPEQESERR